jgi:hypothetical protein
MEITGCPGEIPLASVELLKNQKKNLNTKKIFSQKRLNYTGFVFASFLP